ncbi:MAG: glutamyl-tRNA reductase [Actinobacteria bacterium]|nr:glutamyl-tRNA reductase [Actinomycetota bacterium]
MSGMSLIVVGLNHRTAPVSVLERVAISEESLPKALHQLGTYEHVLEGAILSTCNRTEIYAMSPKFHAGVQDLRNFLGDFCHVAPEDLADHLYTFHEDGAVRHLFRVASGIDSMVLGESEILGQVRRSYQVALEEGLATRVLAAAFRQALRVGKRARTETAIGRNPVSISSAAVELARKAFANKTLEGRSIAVVGAGKMGALAAKALARSGASTITVVNRTEEKAQTLADDLGIEARPWTELEQTLAEADIVISSTTASATVIDKLIVEAAIDGRTSPLLLVDIAVPRDIETSVAELPNVVLRDIDDLRGVVETNLGSRVGEISKVEEIIAAELARFVEWERATEVGPTVSALVARADELKTEELDRLASRAKQLTDEQRAEIEHSMTRLISKLLHVPINRAKELATSKQGYVYVTALRELFELDHDVPE